MSLYIGEINININGIDGELDSHEDGGGEEPVASKVDGEPTT